MQAGFYLVHEFAIAVFNGVTAFVRVGFDRVEVELDSIGASLFHFTGITNPATRRGAVQTGDDGNCDGLFCAMNQLQVAFRASVVGLEIGEIGDGLGEFLGPAREILVN